MASKRDFGRTLYMRHKRVLEAHPRIFRRYDQMAQIGYALAFAFSYPDNDKAKELEAAAQRLLEEIKRDMLPEDWAEFMRHFGL